MTTFRFTPDQSFREVRTQMRDLNEKKYRQQIATLTWLEGVHANQSLTFLWDPYAERFGHQIDKSSIDEEIVTSLINDIAVNVEVHPPRHSQE